MAGRARPDPQDDDQSAEPGDALLIGHVRRSRLHAREAAIAELCSLLEDLGATVLSGGPLSDQRGVYWLSLPAAALDQAAARLPFLGYSSAVDHLVPAAAVPTARSQRHRSGFVYWRGHYHQIVRLYEEDAEEDRERAVDRRVFLLEGSDGAVRVVRGYRGSSLPGARRGLPVCDARLLANLVLRGTRQPFLDPFAGAGGIVLEAAARGARMLSADRDPTLRRGLAALGATHLIADARQLPLRSGTISAIATEPPYAEVPEQVLRAALGEMARVLSRGGRLALLCAAHQAAALREAASSLGLRPTLDVPIDRKGLSCVVLAWRKPEEDAVCPNPPS